MHVTGLGTQPGERERRNTETTDLVALNAPAGPDMTVQTREIRRELSAQDRKDERNRAAQAAAAAVSAAREVLAPCRGLAHHPATLKRPSIKTLLISLTTVPTVRVIRLPLCVGWSGLFTLWRPSSAVPAPPPPPLPSH